jgi:hypothetical protein
MALLASLAALSVAGASEFLRKKSATELENATPSGMALGTLSAHSTWSGITEAGTLGATITLGQLCYLQTSDSRWELADANVNTYDMKLGICLVAGNDGSTTTMLLYGKVRSLNDDYPTFTIGKPVYMGETAGGLVVTQPTTADVAIRVIGFGNSADELFFNPSNDYIIHT